jgi:hypothetical protein
MLWLMLHSLEDEHVERAVNEIGFFFRHICFSLDGLGETMMRPLA